jgi:streptogramin lyase
MTPSHRRSWHAPAHTTRALRAVIAVIGGAGALQAQQCDIVPRSGSSSDVTLASAGAGRGPVWYVDQQANLLMRMDAARTLRAFPPNDKATGEVTTAAVATDGTVWYAKRGRDAGAVGFITADGASGREFPLPRAPGRTVGAVMPQSMRIDRSGNIWLVDPVQNVVARVTPTGTVTHAPFPAERSSGVLPSNLALDADGGVWVASMARNAVYRMDPSSSAFERIAISGTARQPRAVAVASDGAVWVALKPERDTGRVLRIDRARAVTEFAIGPGRADFLLADERGGMWFSKPLYSSAGHISSAGALATITCGTVGALAFGPDSRPWSLGASMLILPASLTPQTTVVALPSAPAEAMRRHAGTIEQVPAAGLAERVRSSRGRLFLHLTSDDRGCPFCVRNVSTFVQFGSLQRETATLWEARWSPWRSAFDDPFVAALGLKGLPVVLRFDDGVETGRITGNVPAARMMDSLVVGR